MPPLTKDELLFAIDDVRKQHDAAFKLIGDMNKEAMSFLQLYVTLAAAAFSGAAGVLLQASKSYPAALGIGLVAFGVFTMLAAIHCLRALWPDKVSLPGRSAAFWLWANREDIDTNVAFVGYLEDMVGHAATNRSLNARMSETMRWAKSIGVAAPLVGAVAGLIAYQIA